MLFARVCRYIGKDVRECLTNPDKHTNSASVMSHCLGHPVPHFVIDLADFRKSTEQIN